MRDRTKARPIAVHYIAISGQLSGVQLVLLSSLSGFRGTRSLLSGWILFGETLLDRFRLPVVVSDSPAVFDDSTSKLSEHRPGCDDGDLS